MLDFLKALKLVERSAKFRFCDDAELKQTTMIIGVHYGDEAVLNKLDNAHAGIRPGTVSMKGKRIRVIGARREHDFDKKNACYSITTELLTKDGKELVKQLAS